MSATAIRDEPVSEAAMNAKMLYDEFDLATKAIAVGKRAMQREGGWHDQIVGRHRTRRARETETFQMAEAKLNHASGPGGHQDVFRALAKSHVYRDYAEDFSRTTGLPVSLTPVDSWQLAHHRQPHGSPFCSLLARQSQACAACLRTQHRVANAAAPATRTVECVHGLCESAVPVRAGKHLFGFVRTGQVFRHAPTSEGFERVLKRLARWGVTLDAARLREAYFATRVIAPAQYRSNVGLLGFLARHLSIMSNQILLQQTNAENPMITRAKMFIEVHYGEKLSLHHVAKAVNASRFYFCKAFKRATGINFNRYVARVRVEKAKSLLLNPHYRVSEIGYHVGFGSLVSFNRMFQRFTGLSPTAYRAQLGTCRNGRTRPGNLDPDHLRTPLDLVNGFARKDVNGGHAVADRKAPRF